MKRIFCYIACFLPLVLLAQKGYQLRVITNPVDAKFAYKTKFASQQLAQNYLQKLPTDLLSKGYLSASIDSVTYDSSGAKAWLYLGRQYHWGTLKIPAGYDSLLKFSGAGRAVKTFDFSRVQPADVQKKLLEYYANTGHPFASVGLDSVVLTGDTITAVLAIQPGPLYRFDSVHVSGGLKVKPAFLYRYLQVQKAMPYQQQLIDDMDKKLVELPFAELLQPTELSLLASGATANVFLKQKRSNIINVLLGLMPASTQTPNNKLQLTGDANILLRNAFANGETLGINWQQIQYKSPRITLSFQQPYLFGTAAGLDLYFDLLKKDSQFVNLNFRIGLPHQLSRNSTIKVFFQQLQTTVGFIDTNEVKTSKQLPVVNDVSSSNIGLDYWWNSTNYKLNPSRGWEANLNGMAGLKKVKMSSSITALKDSNNPGYEYSALYDSVKKQTYQLRLKANAAKYLSTGKQTVLKLSIQAGWLQSQNYYRNELFQLGGYRLLRGFDEESIFARGYTVATAEYRLLAGKNGYFFAFADGGFAQYKDELQQYSHSYIGTGLGLVVDTKNSLINLSWAFGKRNDLPLDLRQSKIHLGFINYF